ncbi:MAG: MBOAT family protein [Clostridia bacterium]|nr:MBOAT family protein [Clostridia bacterium]
MIFNSLTFVVFFIAVAVSYYLVPHKLRYPHLLAASLIFYMWSDPASVIWLAITTLVTWFAGILIGSGKSKSSKKTWLIISLVINFGILFVFKYFNLFGEGVNALFGLLGSKYEIARSSLAAPIGISFYTFQAVGYTIDVYRGKKEPQKNLLKYSVFVSFFPVILSGPIQRSDVLMPQLEEYHKFDYGLVTSGLKLCTMGLFKKIVVADTIAVYVNNVFGNIDAYDGFGLIVASILFTLQIYCDFSGYSDIAIGVARILGFRLGKNFDHPYFSTSIKDFWKRWHISLSSWFGSYLYIPLGGNRCSKARKYFNIMVTFLVSGIWHGASLTFIVWGALHGVYRVFGEITLPLREKIHKAVHYDKAKRLKKAVSIFITFSLVSFAWIFFKASDIGDAFRFVGRLFTFNEGFGSRSYFFTELKNIFGERREMYLSAIVLPTFLFVSVFDHFKPLGAFISRRPQFIRFLIYLFAILFIAIFARPDMQDFIYVQF